MYQNTGHKPQKPADPSSAFPDYLPQAIEPKWQRIWEESGIYRAGPASEKPKYYCLDFFPYPSGEGLHVGHCRNYVPTDVISRYHRMRGENVLHPMGWDAFGEPTEQAAILHGLNPRETTDRNTANFRRQMTIIGTGYDWSREIDSSKPDYYRWTQWFFLLLYKRGLAYRDTNWQWWCPVCQTTLSSHEVSNGVCWRGHTGVTKREIPAWYFRITAYADELISGLDTVDWPEPIKAMQRNWIGRSEGAEISFPVSSADPKEEQRKPQFAIHVFTTRPDTLFGVTFLSLAPEHPDLARLTTPERAAEVEDYRLRALSLSEVDRMSEEREKTGVFTGGYAKHPLSGEPIPVWVADYVMGSYGTGAVMGVPAHDQRDFEFAREFGLPVRAVIVPPGEAVPDVPAAAFTGEGVLVNSGGFDGLASSRAIEAVIAALQDRGLGKPSVQYRMRDWLISRQRYWGTPVPIVICPECGDVPVPEDELPVLLPEMDNFQPDGSGRSPLARVTEFVNTTCPRCGGPAQRETDTMGGFACSSWYFLRFTNPHYASRLTGPIDPQAVDYWMPVDLYVGGAEHAVLHLLYARFWTKALSDAGLLPFREPFAKLVNQGQLMGPDGKRMSKSRGNVITPDSVVETSGADALRVYEMFMAPFDQDIPWRTEGLNGSRRFLNRVWSLYKEAYGSGAPWQGVDPELERLLHRTVRRVTERIEGFRFNTMVSALMEFTNALADLQRLPGWRTVTFRHALDALLVLLAPAAPHITEELWALTGHSGSVHTQPWLRWDPELAREETVELPVQVNGRLRGVIAAGKDASEAEAVSLADQSEKLQPYLIGKNIKKIIYVPGKILNLVVE